MVHTKHLQQEKRMSFWHSFLIVVATIVSFGLFAMPAVALQKEFIAEKIPNVPNNYLELFTDSGHSVGYTSLNPNASDDHTDRYHRRPDGSFSIYTRDDNAHQGDIAVSNAGRVAFLNVEYDKFTIVKATVRITEPDGKTTASYVLPLDELNVESPYLDESNIERFNYFGLSFDDSEILYIWGDQWTSIDGSRAVVFENSKGDFSPTVFESLDSHSVVGVDGTGAIYLFNQTYSGCRMVSVTIDNHEPSILTDPGKCITGSEYDKNNITRTGEFLTGYSPKTLHYKNAQDHYQEKRVRVRARKYSKRKAKNKYFILGNGSIGGSYLAGYVDKRGPALQSKERPSSLRHRKMLNRITIKPERCRLHGIASINVHDEMLVRAVCRENGKNVFRDMLVKPIVK